ncbi:unnamed protein product [Enterobius vermicularis]|uniref:BHLH domain-containing protein n=1 Tax=Enterobius vermicularis TaxID=51028 RepID=A0A0N4VAK6_ENTVE|nr:unnamed protein product [Enterobius vermicularis]
MFIVNSIAIYRYRQCMKLYTSGAIKVRFENNENDVTAANNTTRRTLISRKIHTRNSVQRKANNKCKVRYSDLRLSFSVIVATSPHMKKQMKPAALRLLECYCFKSAVERDMEMVIAQIQCVVIAC